MKQMIFAMALLAASSCALPAAAQSMNCGPHEKVTQVLDERYSEQLMLKLDTTAHQEQGFSISELWMNIDTGSFTYLFVNTNKGIACLGDSGGGIEFVMPTADEPEGDPT